MNKVGSLFAKTAHPNKRSYQTTSLIASAKKQTFRWSFQPIVFCLWTLGVSWPYQEERPLLQSAIRIGCYFWFAVNMSNVIYLIIHDITGEGFYEEFLPNCFLMVILFVDHVQSSGIYMAFLWATWRHGGKLLEAFQLIEAKYQTSMKYYAKIRLLATSGVLLSILTVSFFILSIFV